MTRISPEQFRDAFLQVASAAQAECLAHWDAKSDFTTHIVGTILTGIAPLLRLKPHAEYHKLDCVYYAECDNEHFGTPSYYATCLSVVVEHENEISSSAEEMNKLQILNVPLKVLITYADAEAQRTLHLARYAKIVRAADIFGDFATLRRQIVIFGSRDDCNAFWHFYVYAEDGFRELQVS